MRATSSSSASSRARWAASWASLNSSMASLYSCSKSCHSGSPDVSCQSIASELANQLANQITSILASSVSASSELLKGARAAHTLQSGSSARRICAFASGQHTKWVMQRPIAEILDLSVCFDQFAILWPTVRDYSVIRGPIRPRQCSAPCQGRIRPTAIVTL